MSCRDPTKAQETGQRVTGLGQEGGGCHRAADRSLSWVCTERPLNEHAVSCPLPSHGLLMPAGKVHTKDFRRAGKDSGKFARNKGPAFGGGACWVTKSCPTLATPWTVALQALLSMGFPRQGYWSGLPVTSPGHLPSPGIEPTSPVWQADSTLRHLGSPCIWRHTVHSWFSGGSERQAAAEMGFPCRYGIDRSCLHQSHPLPLNCWHTAPSDQPAVQTRLLPGEKREIPAFLCTEWRGWAHRTASQDGCRFSGSRGRGWGSWGRRLPRGPGSMDWGLSVNWFMSRMECVGIRAPWKPPGGKTIGRRSLLWTLAVLPTLTLGLRILLLVLWSETLRRAGTLAGFAYIFREDSTGQHFGQKVPHQAPYCLTQGETCIIWEERTACFSYSCITNGTYFLSK